MRSDQDIWKCEEAGQLVILENLSREIFEENVFFFPHRHPAPPRSRAGPRDHCGKIVAPRSRVPIE